MRYAFASVIIILGSVLMSTSKPFAFELPQIWTKDFTISISRAGGMDGSSTNVTFTYATAKYAIKSMTDGLKEGSFELMENDRNAILKKMHELKADKIHSEISPSAVDDGWSSTICFNQHCIEGGSSARMSDDDKQRYLSAYRFLHDYILKEI